MTVLDQDTERSDAGLRVNILIFTLGAPAGDEAGHPVIRVLQRCGGKRHHGGHVGPA